MCDAAQSLLVGVDAAVAQSASMNHDATTSATKDEMTARHTKSIVAYCDKAAQDIKDIVRASIQVRRGQGRLELKGSRVWLSRRSPRGVRTCVCTLASGVWVAHEF